MDWRDGDNQPSHKSSKYERDPKELPQSLEKYFNTRKIVVVEQQQKKQPNETNTWKKEFHWRIPAQATKQIERKNKNTTSGQRF